MWVTHSCAELNQSYYIYMWVGVFFFRWGGGKKNQNDVTQLYKAQLERTAVKCGGLGYSSEERKTSDISKFYPPTTKVSHFTIQLWALSILSDCERAASIYGSKSSLCYWVPDTIVYLHANLCYIGSQLIHLVCYKQDSGKLFCWAITSNMTPKYLCLSFWILQTFVEVVLPVQHPWYPCILKQNKTRCPFTFDMKMLCAAFVRDRILANSIPKIFWPS